MSLISAARDKARAVPSADNVQLAARPARFTQVADGGRAQAASSCRRRRAGRQTAAAGGGKTQGGRHARRAMTRVGRDGTWLAPDVLSCANRQNAVGPLSYW